MWETHGDDIVSAKPTATQSIILTSDSKVPVSSRYDARPFFLGLWVLILENTRSARVLPDKISGYLG